MESAKRHRGGIMDTIDGHAKARILPWWLRGARYTSMVDPSPRFGVYAIR